MDERLKTAFDFAQETVKQLITLAVGIVGLTITFLHDLAPNATQTALHLIEASWFVYLLSIILGVFTLQQLTGNLEKFERPSIYARGIVWAAGLQVVLFVLGTLLVILFGVSVAGHVSR